MSTESSTIQQKRQALLHVSLSGFEEQSVCCNDGTSSSGADNNDGVFSILSVTHRNVKKKILKLCIFKSTGLDSLHQRVLKCCLSSSLDP